MEFNNSSSDSDERMKKRFSFEVSGEKKKDDDKDEKASSKEKSKKDSDKKAPSRSLFFGGNRPLESETTPDKSSESVEKSEAQEVLQREVLLRSILKPEQPLEKSEVVDSHEEGSALDSDTAKDEEQDNDNSDLSKNEIVENENTSSKDAELEQKVDTAAETERMEAQLQEIVEDKIEKLQSEVENRTTVKEAEETKEAQDISVDDENTESKAAELASNLSFLEKVTAKMKDGVEAPVAIEESVAESLDGAENGMSEENETEDVLLHGETAGEFEGEFSGEEVEGMGSEDDEDSPVASAATATATAPSASSSSSSTASSSPTPPSRPIPSAPTPSTPVSPPPFSPPPGSPPRSPLPPHSPLMPPSPGVPRFNTQPAPSFNPNILTAPFAAGNTVRVNDVYRRNRNTGKLILAGVVGYAFGRRRGRIRTENRLQPQINEGQKHIRSLEQKLETTEQVVRQKSAELQRSKDTVSEYVVQKQETEKARRSAEQALYDERQQVRVPTAAEMLAGAQPQTAARVENVPAAQYGQEYASPASALRSAEQTGNRTPSELLTEAIPLPQPEVSLGKELLRAPLLAITGAEALTSMNAPDARETREAQQRREAAVLQAERDPALVMPEAPAVVAETVRPKLSNAELRQQAAEQAKKKAAAAEQGRAELSKTLDVHSMTMPELLTVAEKIDVGSGNLKDMFEHRRIDAVNLRRVIAEFVQGRNIQETLHRSLEAEEMHRELRNEVKTDDSASSSGVNAANTAKTVDIADAVKTAQTDRKTGEAGLTNSGSGGGSSAAVSTGLFADASKPLAIPPPSSSFLSESRQSVFSEANEAEASASAASTSVVIALGVAAGAAAAGILLLILGIV